MRTIKASSKVQIDGSTTHFHTGAIFSLANTTETLYSLLKWHSFGFWDGVKLKRAMSKTTMTSNMLLFLR